MSDREKRLVDALRKGPRPSPPEGLNQAIKDQIPQTIPSRSRSFMPGSKAWLVAAALLVMLGTGWMAFLLIRPESPLPATTVAERSPSAAADDLGPRSDDWSDRSEVSTQAAESADRDLKETPAAVPEAEARNRQRKEQDKLADDLRPEPPTPPAAPVPAAAPPPAVDRAERESRASRQESAVQRPGVPKQRRAAAPEPAAVATREPVGQISTGSRDADDTGLEPAAVAEELVISEQTSGKVTLENGPSDALSYRQIRESILEGRLPDPDSIDVQGLINHFEYGDQPPWRRGDLSLFLEGGATPFRSGLWRTVRIGIRSGSSRDRIGDQTQLEVHFDPATVALYRRAGGTVLRQPDEEASFEIELGELGSEYSQSWLFEVRLLDEIGRDEPVARASLRYITPTRERMEIERSLHVGHIAPTWRTTSSSLRTATLVGRWAESMKRTPTMAESVELLQRARELESTSDTEDSLDELAGLIDRTVKLLIDR